MSIFHLIDVDEIEPNGWNPNMVSDNEYEALKQDMRVHGVSGVDPILVSHKGVYELPVPIDELPGGAWDKAFKVKGFVIVDGEHRWRVAKELGWKEIRAISENIREEDAKALCYRRNRERGTIDPFKEAALFKSELDKMTQKAVAGKYGVDQSTVSHRLSLLKVDSDVLEAVHNLPRGIITTSHLEPLASLESEDQKKLAKDIVMHAKQWQQPMTVKEVENQAERLREEREQARQLKEAIAKAKFPKCPKCAKSPCRINYKKLPWVDCESGKYDHTWSLTSGKLVYEPIRESQNTLEGESKPLQPMTLRSAHTVKDLSIVFANLIKKIITQDENLILTKVSVDGKRGGSDFSFDVRKYGKTMSVDWHQGGTWLGFRAEEHDYKTGEKSSVTTGSPDRLERVKELIENAFNGKLGVEKTKKEVEEDLEEATEEANS